MTGAISPRRAAREFFDPPISDRCLCRAIKTKGGIDWRAMPELARDRVHSGGIARPLHILFKSGDNQRGSHGIQAKFRKRSS